MSMVLLTLFAALVCLVLGLVFASGPWLIASLVCSALAAIVLWRQRTQGKPHSSVPSRAGRSSSAQSASPASARLVTGSAFAGAVAQAGGRRPKPGGNPSASHEQVWVVDGKPEYHRQECVRIADADAEPIPLDQARSDGFTECLGCTPVPGSSAPVWVIDGRPDYHRSDCARLSRGTPEQIRLGQALDDGFSPCDQCRPEGTPADEPSEPADPMGTAEPAATDQVWVVDGRPRYHLETCMIIQDQDAEPIPLAQATEDGFMPCSMCEPFVSRV